MPDPRKLPSLDSCQTSFLWAYKEVDLAPHPVVGLVLLVGDAKKFPQARCVENLDSFFFLSFFKSQQTGSMFRNYRGEWR